MLKETLNFVYDTMKPMGYDPIDRMKDYILYGIRATSRQKTEQGTR